MPFYSAKERVALPSLLESAKSLAAELRCVWAVQGVLHASGSRILFVDADGATRFEDLALLEDELGAVTVTQAARSNRAEGTHGLVVGSRAHLVSTEAVVKVRAYRKDRPHPPTNFVLTD